MKKDITPPEVINVAVAIVQEKNELNETIWNVLWKLSVNIHLAGTRSATDLA